MGFLNPWARHTRLYVTFPSWCFLLVTPSTLSMHSFPSRKSGLSTTHCFTHTHSSGFLLHVTSLWEPYLMPSGEESLCSSSKPLHRCPPASSQPTTDFKRQARTWHAINIHWVTPGRGRWGSGTQSWVPVPGLPLCVHGCTLGSPFSPPATGDCVGVKQGWVWQCVY